MPRTTLYLHTTSVGRRPFPFAWVRHLLHPHCRIVTSATSAPPLCPSPSCCGDLPAVLCQTLAPSPPLCVWAPGMCLRGNGPKGGSKSGGYWWLEKRVRGNVWRIESHRRQTEAAGGADRHTKRGEGPLGQGCILERGGGAPLQGAQPTPSHCLPNGKRQLQWHLQPTVTAPNRFCHLLQPPVYPPLRPLPF